MNLCGVWSFHIEIVEIGQAGVQYTTIRSCSDSSTIFSMVGGEEAIASFMLLDINL